MGKIADFFKRLKRIRHIELYACAAALVMVLVVYFSCVSCAKSDNTSADIDISGADYCTAMQARLEKIVSEIDGVGRASVVINWDKSVPSSFMSGGADNPKATGVIVVCEGGNSTKVKLDVTYAVSTLLGLSIDSIIVYPKSN